MQTSMSCRFNSSTLYGFVCGRHDAAWQCRSRNPQDRPRLFGGYRLDARKFGVSWRSSSTVARARRSVLVHCPAGTKSLSLAAVWRHYDVVKQHQVSKRYSENFLLCNNNEIIACIADLFNSFCEVYVVALFKVVQQQTIGEVGNSIKCLLADNFCLQQWKNY